MLVKVEHEALGFISYENVFLSDFGIRHWFSKFNRETRQMMRVVGTVPYVAPEVSRGGEAALTTAADIWAVGCIGYELFTGTRLFETEAMMEHFVNTGYVDPIQLAKLRERPKMFDVLSGCLNPNITMRSTTWKLLELLGPSAPTA